MVQNNVKAAVHRDDGDRRVEHRRRTLQHADDLANAAGRGPDRGVDAPDAVAELRPHGLRESRVSPSRVRV